jgi:membrane protein YqaA with SNARE-associated domain
LEGNLLLDVLRKNRLGIKYSILTVLLVGVVLVLSLLDVLGGAEDAVNHAMDRLAEWGAPGMFLIALPSNMTLVIQVPYNLPMFSLIIFADHWLDVMWIGVATGLGGGIGEVTSYAVAHAIVSRVDDLEESALFRWTRNTIERRPRFIPFFIWLASATPVPDLMIIIPVAMVRYPWQKMIIPMITGKIFQNVVVAFIFYLATEQAESLTTRDLHFDLTAAIAIVFVMIIIYQIEKSRQEEDEPQPSTQES